MFEPLSDLTQPGLGGLERVELTWGFDQEALLGTVELWHQLLAQVLLRLLDQPSFGIGSLPRIPAKVSGLTVMSIDLAKSYDLVDALIKLTGADRGHRARQPGDHGTTRDGLTRTYWRILARSWRSTRSPIFETILESAAELMASRAAGTTFQASFATGRRWRVRSNH